VSLPTSDDFRNRPGAGVTPSPVVDKSEETEAGLDEEDGGHNRGRGLRISLSGQLTANEGTFRFDQNQYTRNPMLAWSTSLSPSYTFADSTRISASASLNQELTISDGDDDPQTLLFGDIQFGLSRPIYKFEDGGPRISGSLSASIPTSDSSRASTLRTTLGAGIGLGQQLSERWSLSFNTAVRKNFHEYTSPVRDPRASSIVTRDGLAVVELSTGIARDGGPELRNEATYVEPGVNNTSFSLSNGIGVSYSATEKLGFGLNYQLSNSWTYEGFARDELSGVGAQAGRGRRDSHAASISASYQLMDNLSLSAGVANGGATRTADDRRIRIPFLSFEGQELTMFSVGVTYTQPVPL
jgi:hypothetical protein